MYYDPVRNSILREADLCELEVLGRVRLLAVGAEDADEALGEDADDARANEERLDLHLHEARDGAGGVVGVEIGRAHV